MSPAAQGEGPEDPCHLVKRPQPTVTPNSRRHPERNQQMPDDTSAAVVNEFEAESWPLEAAADTPPQGIEGFDTGDPRPLGIAYGPQPVLVVLAISDLADFRARIAELLGKPV